MQCAARTRCTGASSPAGGGTAAPEHPQHAPLGRVVRRRHVSPASRRMVAPHDIGPACAQYARAMRPCTSDDGFDHRRAEAAIRELVWELSEAGERAAAIVNLAVEMVPLRGSQAQSVWGLSLRDWVRTTARAALAGTGGARSAHEGDGRQAMRPPGLRLER